MTEFFIDRDRIGQMAGHLVSPLAPLPDAVDVAVVFGRCSDELLHAGIAVAERSRYTITTGRLGKDAGWLRSSTEADYLGDGIDRATHLDHEPVIRDRSARSGLENARNSVRIMTTLGVSSIRRVVAVTHPVQSRRLTGMLRYALDKTPGLAGVELLAHPSRYQLDLDNEKDLFEVVNEITLIDAYGRARKPRMHTDILPDADMVAYAQDVKRYLLGTFALQGIKNPSTADGTDPYMSMAQLMTRYTPGVVHPLAQGAVIISNMIGVWRAKRAVTAATAR